MENENISIEDIMDQVMEFFTFDEFDYALLVKWKNNLKLSEDEKFRLWLILEKYKLLSFFRKEEEL